MSEIQPQDIGDGKPDAGIELWTDLLLGKDCSVVTITDESCNTCRDQLIHHNEIMLKLTTNQRRFHKIAEKNEKKLKDEIHNLNT